MTDTAMLDLGPQTRIVAGLVAGVPEIGRAHV